MRRSLLGLIAIAPLGIGQAITALAQEFREWDGAVVFPPDGPPPRVPISGLPPGWAGYSVGTEWDKKCVVAKVSNYNDERVDVIFSAGSSDDKDFSSFDVTMYHEKIDFNSDDEDRKIQLLVPESADATYFAAVGAWDPEVLTTRLPNKPLLNDLSKTKAFVVILPHNGVSFVVDMTGSGKALKAMQSCRIQTKPPTEDDLCNEFDDCDD